jgi:hypothetical protein
MLNHKYLIILALICTTAQAQWNYRTEKDEMRGTKTFFALLRSLNRAQLTAPHKGETPLHITLRKKSDDDFDVILWIEDGKFQCDGSCSISMKFDAEDIEEWPVKTIPGTKVMILTYSGVFIDKLRTAKSLIMEVTHFSGVSKGSFQFKFNTRGLKWE